MSLIWQRRKYVDDRDDIRRLVLVIVKHNKINNWRSYGH
jgi:hypothetical protein